LKRSCMNSVRRKAGQCLMHTVQTVQTVQTVLRKSLVCRRTLTFSKGMWPIGYLNPLNAELNPICHLLILLGDLTFMGPCIVSVFQYISNKMQRYTLYLYLETALHVSGGTLTHHQERIQLYLQYLVFAIWHMPPTAHSNRFQLFHDSGR
jgi:hypothetical protein